MAWRPGRIGTPKSKAVVFRFDLCGTSRVSGLCVEPDTPGMIDGLRCLSFWKTVFMFTPGSPKAKIRIFEQFGHRFESVPCAPHVWKRRTKRRRCSPHTPFRKGASASERQTARAEASATLNDPAKTLHCKTCPCPQLPLCRLRPAGTCNSHFRNPS